MTLENPAFRELVSVVCDTCEVARCREILDSGLDVNTATSTGGTALMLAVMPNEFGDHNSPRATLEIVRTLLARGADPTIVDSHGLTAAQYARQLIDPS